MTRLTVIVAAAAVLLIVGSATALDLGFARATSSAGQFSVLLPKPFRALPPNSGENPTATIRPKESFFVGGTPAAGITFVATKLIYSTVSDARSIVSSLTTAEPPGFRRLYMKRADVAGLPGIEVKSRSSSAVGYRRVILRDDAVFVLAVEAPAGKEQEIEQAAMKFLNSLELTSPPKV